MAHRFQTTLGALVLTAGSASCAHTNSAHPAVEDGALKTGVAFVGKDQVTYTVWSIFAGTIVLGVFDGATIGSGTVVCINDPERESRRPEHVLRWSSVQDWVGAGYDGWLWYGTGIWDDGLLPSRVRSNYPPYKQCVNASSFFDVLLPLRREHPIIISIVPPVLGFVDAQEHDCLRDNKCPYSYELGGYMCAVPDLDCVVWELLSVRSTDNGKDATVHRLLPKGTKMTIREIFQRGPALWQEDLDAVAAQLEPRVFQDPKYAK